MNCRKCGKEIPEGSLYCDICGADVRIVPVFEAEVEQTMQKTLSEVFEQAFPEKETEADTEELSKTHNHLMLGIVLGTLICIIAIAVTIYFYLGNTLEYQLGRAAQLYNNGKYETAISYFEKAVELDKENIDNRLWLADAYLAVGNDEKYLATLQSFTEFMEDIPTLRTLVCDRYVSFYTAKGDYKGLHEALKATVSEAIYDAYAAYIVTPVVFSHSGGYYKEIVPLKLSNPLNGTIYYTLDGSEPTTKSTVYDTPIFLADGGKYVVKALFVSDKGVHSEIITNSYEIEKQAPAAPLVTPMSGEFNEHQMIVVDKEEYEDIYYTTNGTDPTITSERYIGPIEMPVGYTLFRCIKVSEDGQISEITEREYLLFINESTNEVKGNE